MQTEINHLKDIVIKNINSSKNRKVKRLILENELSFIYQRRLEDYIFVAHKLFTELRKDKDIILGPGLGNMIGSHLFYTLGVTNIPPTDAGSDPILIWGNDSENPILDIEVDMDSFHNVFRIAVELFGHDNVVKMAKDMPSEETNHAVLIICLDGAANQFEVEEVIEDGKNSILYTEGMVEVANNATVFRYNIIASKSLSRIKRIQNLVEKNGKECPRLYQTDIWNKDYEAFYSGDLDGIPMFEDKKIQMFTKLSMTRKKYNAFDDLLTVQGLCLSTGGNLPTDSKAISAYQEKHAILTILNSTRFPWGILFEEDASWLLHSWIGLTWKQTASVIRYAKEQNEKELTRLKTHFLQQGMENGFEMIELERIWNSISRERATTAFPSRAHYAGRVYLSVYLAELKKSYPKEFWAASW